MKYSYTIHKEQWEKDPDHPDESFISGPYNTSDIEGLSKGRAKDMISAFLREHPDSYEIPIDYDPSEGWKLIESVGYNDGSTEFCIEAWRVEVDVEE